MGRGGEGRGGGWGGDGEGDGEGRGGVCTQNFSSYYSQNNMCVHMSTQTHALKAVDGFHNFLPNEVGDNSVCLHLAIQDFLLEVQVSVKCVETGGQTEPATHTLQGSAHMS